MTEVEVNTPSKSNQLKRKIEIDSDDELLLEYMNDTKKKSLEPKTNEDKNEGCKNDREKEDSTFTPKKEKENIDTKSNCVSSKKPHLDSPKIAYQSPLLKNKLVQAKLSFRPLEAKSPNPKKEEPKSKSPVQSKEEPKPKTPIKNTEEPKTEEKETEEPIEDELEQNNDEFRIENYLLDPEWKKMLKDEFKKPYFIEINQKIQPGYEKGINRPPKELVFNALNTTKLKNIKVVVIGQDPYHNDGQAHGLSFSVPIGKALPPSLKNIFTELKNDIPEFKRDEKLGGCLQKWAEGGVFLLNTFLTVEAHKAGSHSKFGWDIFTDRVIKLISEKNSGCAFMLWGNFAQKKESLIDKKKHKVVKCAHPSPFSATRFFGSKCFSVANAYLKSIGKEPVDWNLV